MNALLLHRIMHECTVLFLLLTTVQVIKKQSKQKTELIENENNWKEI
jgi:hypothetical protein